MISFVGGMRDTMNFKGGMWDENTITGSGMCSLF